MVAWYCDLLIGLQLMRSGGLEFQSMWVALREEEDDDGDDASEQDEAKCREGRG